MMFTSLPSFPSFIGENSVPAVIDGNRFTHEVNYTLSRHIRNLPSPTYFYKWLMRAECAECGWSFYTVRNCDGVSSECNITQHDKDLALANHHRGVGIFAIREGDFRFHIFVREDDGSEYLMRHGHKGWQAVASNTENGWVEE